MAIKEVTAQQAHDILNNDTSAVYIDVRTEREFASGHPQGAVNIPVAFPDPARGMMVNENFVTVIEAYEVQLSDLRLPESTGGTLAFRPCAECDYETVRVTAGTRYEANDQAYALEEFRLELERIPDPQEQSVTVMHHLESNTITAVRVSF